jgi:anti-sigma factor ChrR (cupin superfamily)
MSSAPDKHNHEQLELLCLYALEVLPSSEIPALEAHISGCRECQNELESLRPVTASLAAWPTDVLRPPRALRQRLAERIASDTGGKPFLPPSQGWTEPQWEEVAPGISCKLLAIDNDSDRVSMLVRLAPGADYPPHTHAGLEELHLLEGELMINDKKLYPGDYNRAEPGTADRRVWSATGCTCVLVTSSRDQLG